jgi:hypothetical protein
MAKLIHLSAPALSSHVVKRTERDLGVQATPRFAHPDFLFADGGRNDGDVVASSAGRNTASNDALAQMVASITPTEVGA